MVDTLSGQYPTEPDRTGSKSIEESFRQMLVFTWVFGDMTENNPEEIPVLLADLRNADEEHFDVSFSLEDIAVTVGAQKWVSIEDAEGDSLSPRSFHAPDDETIVEIGRLLDEGRLNEILERYPWQDGYPRADR